MRWCCPDQDCPSTTTVWTRRIVIGSLSLAIALMASPAVSPAAAGPLATTDRALNDGFGPDAGRWHGTAIVMGAAFGDILHAEVDWAAFGPGKFQLFLDDNGIAGIDPSGPGALRAYKINLVPEVKNTVMLYRKRRVTHKFVNLRADEKGLAELKTAIGELTAAAQ